MRQEHDRDNLRSTPSLIAGFEQNKSLKSQIIFSKMEHGNATNSQSWVIHSNSGIQHLAISGYSWRSRTIYSVPTQPNRLKRRSP